MHAFKQTAQKLTSSPVFLPGMVFFVIAMVRIMYFLATLDDPYMRFRVGDEEYYHDWALRIASGEWMRGASFFTTPLFAYFLAGLYAVFPSEIIIVRLVNIVLGLAAIVFTFLAARSLLGRRIAVTATVLLGFCSAPVFYEWFPEKTSLVLFCTALSLYLVSLAMAGTKPALWLAAGLSVGVGSLAHMMLFAMLPAVILHLAVNRKQAAPGIVPALLLFISGFFLGVLPATIHNYLQDRDFVLVSSNGGQNFYTGNFSGNITGQYSRPPFAVPNIYSEEADFKKEAERRVGRPMKPSEVSGFWFWQGLQETMRLPDAGLTRLGRRIRWSLGSGELTDTRSYEFYQSRYRVLNVPFWGFGFISCLGLVGFVLTLRDGRTAVVTSFVALFTFGISLFIVYGRYRLPLVIPLSLLAAAALHRVAGFIIDRRVVPLMLSLVAAGIAGWLVYGVVLVKEDVSFFTDYFNQGNKYLKLGKYDLAAVEYEKALTDNPGYNPNVKQLYLALADFYVERGSRMKALRLLERGIAQFPADNVVLQEKLKQLRMAAPAPGPKHR